MWTYLTILFSFIVLIAVFVHKWILFKRKTNAPLSDAEASETNEAEEEIKLSRADKEKVEGLCKRGEALIKAGKDDEAIKCFVQALAIDSAHIDTLNKLAMLYLQKQMFGAAAALFKQLGEITQDAVHFSHLGLALYQQSDFEGSKSAYQKAVELDSLRPQRFVSLAQVYRSLGQPYNAMVAISKALELEENNPEILYLLADLQIEAGEIVAAQSIVAKLMELDPQNREFKNLLKQVKKLEG